MSDAPRAVMGERTDVEALVDRVTVGVRGPTVSERVEIRRGASRDGLDRLVDRIVDEHEAVRGVLEDDVRRTLNSAGFTVPVAPREASSVASPRTYDDRLPPDLEADLRRVRAERTRVADALRPTLAAPVFDDPVVTRAGVFYVAPDFVQAVGFGPVAEARLAAAGFRSADAVLRAGAEEVAAAADLDVDVARRALADLDLARVPGLDGHGADLLRLAGVHSVSRLAQRDPPFLAREIALLVERHRLERVPAALSGEAAVARLVAAARELAA